jgi:hypothetical protein
MFKKLSIITAITLATFSLTACGGSDEKEPEQTNTQAPVETTETVEATKIEEPKSPYLDANWSTFKDGVENESLITAIDASVENYKKTANKIISDGESYISEITGQINSSIEDGKETIAEQKNTFDENCQDIANEKEHEQCSAIEENIFNTEEQVKGMEVELKNRVGDIQVQLNNQLGKLKTNIMNNINEKRSSEGLDKADPFNSQ